jgi:hypothetical protein
MYHGRDNCTSLASWFIVATPDSYIIQTWAASAWTFWQQLVKDPSYKNHTTDRLLPYEYFFMDGIFTELLKMDPMFHRHWEHVPKLCCEDKGQAHMLSVGQEDNTPEVKAILAENPPWQMKLDRRVFAGGMASDMARKSNGYYAIMQSYRRRVVSHTLQPKGWH